MHVSVFVLPKRLSLLAIVVLSGSSIRSCKETYICVDVGNCEVTTPRFIGNQLTTRSDLGRVEVRHGSAPRAAAGPADKAQRLTSL
jgi:hypothetical protein